MNDHRYYPKNAVRILLESRNPFRKKERLIKKKNI